MRCTFMKKYFILSIIAAIFIAYVPTGFVAAQSNNTDNHSSIHVSSQDNTDVVVNVDEELNINSDQEVETIHISDENIDIYESGLNTEEVNIKSVLNYDNQTGEVTAEASMKDEYGTDLKKTFSIIITDVEGEELKAIFIDKDTGEQYSVDTEKVTASVWPAVGVLIGFIAKSGLKQAIKKWGPSVIKGMIKSSETVAKAVAKNLGYTPTNYTSHGAKVYKAGKKAKGPKYITRDKDSHIGGAWKGADTVKGLGSKKTRSGTYDAELNRIGD